MSSNALSTVAHSLRHKNPVNFHQIFFFFNKASRSALFCVAVLLSSSPPPLSPSSSSQSPWEERGELLSSLPHDEMALPLSFFFLFSPNNPSFLPLLLPDNSSGSTAVRGRNVPLFKFKNMTGCAVGVQTPLWLHRDYKQHAARM